MVKAASPNEQPALSVYGHGQIARRRPSGEKGAHRAGSRGRGRREGRDDAARESESSARVQAFAVEMIPNRRIRSSRGATA
jgi:hypothetical protein